MVYRVYVEKRAGHDGEARELTRELAGAGFAGVKNARVLLRYDVEGIERDVFDSCCTGVFADPRTDVTGFALPETEGAVFAVEYLPGQFDDRANAAKDCIRLVTMGAAAEVRTAKVYIIEGEISAEELEKLKARLINPVDSREASLGEYDSLSVQYEEPEGVDVIEGFLSLDDEGLASLIKRMGLAMDIDDAKCCRDYFMNIERRDPTVAELTVLDTYWSDHCRHTTFTTELSFEFADKEAEEAFLRYESMRRELHMKESRPHTLMDMATIGAKYLKAKGALTALDESEEINACTVKIEADVDGKKEPWLLLFKNETHNHPTEIEPYGGAATCVGGAIRDPLSGRGYVYQSMRVTGAADPRDAYVIPGKLPQRKIVQEAAEGFSSYGNRIGLATGQVREYYHPGYAAKRMEVGAVIAAAPARNVKRLTPEPGDAVLLLGGKTGRDGCGGATGASKAHTASSIETCGAEVQKGNAPEERKLQRLFRSAEAAQMIKRCNDFGAGGVSVAIGELADGLEVELDRVPKKYMGLTATELAVSESQERMAVVVAAEDVKRFSELAEAEGVMCTHVANVTAEPRLRLNYKGQRAVDISREFIDTHGAKKRQQVRFSCAGNLPGTCFTPDCSPGAAFGNNTEKLPEIKGFADKMAALAGDIGFCSQRGLVERFDSTVGAYTVLLPYGGRYQAAPTQAMAAKLPVLSGNTSSVSLMSHGFDPFISEASPYVGAYWAVVTSVCKLIAAGADYDRIWLSLQEYFERLGKDKDAWGKPCAALLGALAAQADLGCAAIGGKDSMSGSFENIHVPPTLISFAAGMGDIKNVISPDLKAAGHEIFLLTPEAKANGLPEAESMRSLIRAVESGVKSGNILACRVPERGGAAESLFLMAIGSRIGVELADGAELFRPMCGAFIIEAAEGFTPEAEGFAVTRLGRTVDEPALIYDNERAELDKLTKAYESALEDIFPTKAETPEKSFVYKENHAEVKAKSIAFDGTPLAVIPVFPGTNCEYETARAFKKAGFDTRVVVIRTGSAELLNKSVAEFTSAVNKAQVLFIPGGFSNSDEPDGSGKFIASFLKNAECRAAVEGLLERKGLIGGICNGFQALVRTGLLPYGEFREATDDMPVLAANLIGRHQSRVVPIRTIENVSPWFALAEPGKTYLVPISHGEGRFTATEAELEKLMENGQILTAYADENGEPTMDIDYNPNGSMWAVEGVCSPDGRIFGKMGHSERIGEGLYKNLPGEYDMRLFEAARKYFG